MRTSYAVADARTKFRMASENPAKIDLVKAILDAHPGEPALVIGMYLDQLAAIARAPRPAGHHGLHAAARP